MPASRLGSLLIAAACLCSMSHAAADAVQDALKIGVVEVHDKKWLVKIRVEQDRPDRPEAGFALRMATSIAVKKLVEFACDFKPATPGEKVSAKLNGLSTLSTNVTAEWAEVVVSADVQKPRCKIEKKRAEAEGYDAAEVAGKSPDPIPAPAGVVVKEIRTEY